jgi:CheY-like chemotaxis protein
MAFPKNLQFKLLFISDKEEKIRLFQEALDESDKLYELLYARTAKEAKDILAYRSKYYIDVIFSIYLDPDSLPLLDHLKSDIYLRKIPVILILDSELPLNACYQHQANCCIVNNDDPEIFKSMIMEAVKYWTDVIALPDGIGRY